MIPAAHASRSPIRHVCSLVAGLLCLGLHVSAGAAPMHAPEGYRVDLPPGWSVVKSSKGHLVFASPDFGQVVTVQPILSSGADCTATLRDSLSNAEARAAGTMLLEVRATSPRSALARYTAGNGKSRGASLCAGTSPRVHMLYGATVPAATYARDWPRAVAVLRSFSYEPASGAGGAAGPLPQLQGWREPNEMAYTLGVPAGWQVRGGIARQDATHYTDGIEAVAPDGVSGIRLGDPRYRPCTVVGPGYASMPQGPNNGMNICQDPSGRADALGQRYVQVLQQDLQTRLEVTGIVPRPDLARNAESMPRSLGLRVQCSVAEVRFAGSLRGSPIAGVVLAKTTFLAGVQGQSFIQGTIHFDLRTVYGPPASLPGLSRLAGQMQSSIQINPQWYAQNMQINYDLAQRTLAVLHQESANQQQLFWDRMAQGDWQREAVNDVLGGTVRLSDGQGNQYNAKAGSNYYFLDQEAARKVGRPDDAVTRGDVWPSNTVDLQPLAVIQ